MNVSINQWNSLVSFLEEFAPNTVDSFVEESDGEYDFILEELNIRNRGEVEMDPTFFYGKEDEFIQKATEALSEWDEEEYISHIDEAAMSVYKDAIEIFERIKAEKR